MAEGRDHTSPMKSDSATWASRSPPRGSFTSKVSAAFASMTRNRSNSEFVLGSKIPQHDHHPQFESVVTSQIYTTTTAINTAAGRRTQASNRAQHTRESSTKPTFQWARGELLGEGSYGRVYLALNATTGEIIAVKQVEVPRGESKKVREVAKALRLEKDTLKHLDHPHIVRYLGFEETHRCLSIFMEYVSGGTITNFLSHQGPFEPETTKHFMKQILQGLEYLHGKGIIHRDLKGDNILVETSGACKISDFGISKQGDDLDGRAHTAMRGTPFWMAPEVLNPSEGGYDTKVDIWSIGCVLSEMWTASRPWAGLADIPVMITVSRDKIAPPLPPELKISKDAWDFWDKCFVPDPIGRASATDLLSHPYLVKRSHRPLRFPEALTHAKGRSRSRAPTQIPSQRTARPPEASTIRPPPRASSTARPRISTTRKHPPEGPPLVVITPPGSPVRVREPDIPPDMLSSASASTSDSGTGTKRPTRRRRSFYVANPDQPGSSKTSYVYAPPPLPDLSRHGTRFSVSNSRDESDHSGLHSHAIRNAKSMHTIHPTVDDGDDTFSSMTWKKLPVSQRSIDEQTYQSKNSTYDSMFWKKPPVHHHTTEENKRHSKDSLSDGDAEAGNSPPAHLRPEDQRISRISRISRHSKMGLESPLERPKMEEIFDNMQEWFPDYDIDKPIIQETNDTTNPSRLHPIRGKKSIRKVAEEQARRADRLDRRATKLWESSMQELQMNTSS
ncbi:hypothetical protein PQX77_003811 [Marasmius sp. AFHP31]|nr:hypothetical protein PQX77_003811 [Marasmius sp. AFHP31]